VTTNLLSVELASGDPLDVRDFSVSEAMSTLFDVRLTAMSTSPDVDFEGAIGGAARFEINRLSAVDGETRYWNGICARVGLIRVEPAGLSTYAVRIVPVMWLLTQRRNYRIFQDLSELDIAQQVLAEWGIQPTLLLDPFSSAFFPIVFPNIAPEMAGVFGGWMLLCCAAALVGVTIQWPDRP